MSKKILIVVLGLIVLIGGWALFRPEKLFVNQTVSEGFPATTRASTASAAPVALAAGQFHKVAHDGRGTATVYRLPDGKRTLRLTNFETSNGPALHLYLVETMDEVLKIALDGPLPAEDATGAVEVDSTIIDARVTH